MGAGAADVSAEDRRAQMYKNMRDELLKEGQKQKTEAQQRKIDELNARVAQMDLEKQRKDEKARQEQAEQQQRQAAAEAQKKSGNKSLLDNIKSFDVEDI